MPRYIIDEAKLEANLQVLASVRERAGVKILLAQKAFSCFELYPLVAKYLDGATASGLFEARLAHEEMPSAPRTCRNCCALSTTSYSTRRVRWRSSAHRRVRRVCRWGCG